MVYFMYRTTMYMYHVLMSCLQHMNTQQHIVYNMSAKDLDVMEQ